MAEHGAVPKGHLPGAEMLSGHVREMEENLQADEE